MGHDAASLHPAPDHRTTVFRSVGRAAPHEWLAALARKRLMPRGQRPALDELSAEQWKMLEVSEAGIFVPRGAIRRSS